MPDTPSLTIVKSMTYRGLPEEWSNTYHFSGDVPADPAGWKALADAVAAEEMKAVNDKITVTRAYGYVAGNEQSKWQGAVADGTLAANQGKIAVSGGQAGDVAVWVRWATPDRNSKGRPIYLRKFYHGVNTGASGDELSAAQRTALGNLGNKLKDGTLPGSFKVCGPQGAVAGAVKVAPFIGFRQLKRTGRRPS